MVKKWREAELEWLQSYLKEALEEARGNVTTAARLVGRNRTDFYKLLKRAGFAEVPRLASEGNAAWRSLDRVENRV